jgi:hypothetical protein
MLSAQDSTASATAERTHLVRPGDTLWQIARSYLNDPWQWREIYRLNAGVVHDPHWIYPKQTLRLPGSLSAVAAPDASATAPIEAEAPESEPQGPTVFAQTSRPVTPVTRVVRVPLRESAPAALPVLHATEIVAAPFVVEAGGPATAGRLVGSGEVPGIPLTEAQRPLQLRERVFIVTPGGRAAQVGDRFLAFARARNVNEVGDVLVPTGVLLVERVPAGSAVEARVVALFAEMFIDQGLLPLEVAPLPPAGPRPVAGGPESRVVWVSGGEPILPSLQNYLVLGGGGAASFRVGDQITLVREARTTEEGIVLGESEIAVARVVHVGAGAATAIVLRQSAPGIGIGTLARVTARLD